MTVPGRVAIIGTGQIGTMLGRALTGLPGRDRDSVWGWDRSPLALRGCLAQGGAQRALSGPRQALGADLVLMAVPVRASLGLIRRLGPEMRPGQLLMDCGSSKAEVVGAMERWVAAGAGAVGGHPICGGTGTGPAAAEPARLLGATFAICPVPGRERAVGPARELVAVLGSRPVVLSAPEHDRIMARTSHLPHLLAAALAELCRGQQLMSGGGLRGAVRLALSDPEMVSSFVGANRREVVAAARDLCSWTERLLAMAEAGDAELAQGLAEARGAAVALVGEATDAA